ncbi:unnamed protein product [Candidula unifasciata]|uniref:G-protein coupled receptors family 1 profile domain-containing protein n=1 Tax=Candidula unifasciata TaxID=100452 RepID=A0A8S3ZN44_9EUPU|nr:unnamed protein product [Candidula unifasciata]
MGVQGQPSSQTNNLMQAHSGQQLHVSGVFIVILELALVVENLLPILVVVVWLPAPARGVSDRLVAAFSITCILSAFIPTPLGLASYFSGGWYGGASTCTTYQVTSIWCNLSSLALLTYICVNCHIAVLHLLKIKSATECQQCRQSVRNNTASIYTTCPAASAGLGASLDSSQHQTVLNAEVLYDTASLFKNTKDCQNIDKEQQFTSVPDNKINAWTETGDDKMDHNSRTYVTTQQATKICTKATTVKGSQNETENSSQHYSNASPSRKRTAFFNEDKISNLTDDDDALTIRQCPDSAVTNHNVNSEPDCQLARDVPPSGPSLAAKCLTPTSNGSLEATNGTKNVKYSQLTPETTLHSLEDDSKNSQYCNTVTETTEQNSKSMKDHSCLPNHQSRDYVSMMIFLVFACTFTISSLPLIGFGPGNTHTATSCRSWLVPIPLSTKERTFFIVYLCFVYTCLVFGCGSGISVCLKVGKRIKQERKRKSRLYHEEENVPDLAELSRLDSMKRHYSLTCVVVAGLLTWVPIVLMLTLQKAGVQVSEATLMYSNIATSLPGLLNPLLYSLALARYRIGYKAVMEKCCKRRTRRSSTVHISADNVETGLSSKSQLNTAADGQVCLHGRINPSYDSHMDVSVDNSEDENDEDYFPDDDELLEDSKNEKNVKASEKTPLQALPTSVSSASGYSLVNHSKAYRQCEPDAFSSSYSDSQSLLVSKSSSADEETGL